MEQILSLVVENKAGVLSRVLSLFSRHEFNVETLNLAQTQDPTRGRVTLTTEADQTAFQGIIGELRQLSDVISVIPYNPVVHVIREMALVRIQVREENRGEVLALSEVFRARVVDASPHSYIFEITGQSEKIDAFLHNMRGYGISEVHRTGKLALTRGSAADNPPKTTGQGEDR